MHGWMDGWIIILTGQPTQKVGNIPVCSFQERLQEKLGLMSNGVKKQKP